MNGISCINQRIYINDDKFNEIDFLCKFIVFPLFMFASLFSFALKHNKIINKSKQKYL